MHKILSFIIFFIIINIFGSKHVFAQDSVSQTNTTTIEGIVTEILKEEVTQQFDGEFVVQELKVQLTTKGYEKEVSVNNVVIPLSGRPTYSVGDRVLVLESANQTGQTYFITDFNRKAPLLWLLALFVFIVVLITKRWGIYSLFGMAYSFFIIFKIVLPRILAGDSPLLVALIGSLIIAPITFYLSHGLNKKTTTAIIGTFLALAITGILAVIFTELSHLTGFGSEEAYFLQLTQGNQLNMQGVLLAGIIIGTLGILDDVTISQASIVQQLKTANPKFEKIALYQAAMKVGHDHISSAVNTLILVYTGAAMPLLLLFINNPLPYVQVINFEIIAEEIVRTLIGSIGLVAAVPITTLLAVNLVDKEQPEKDQKLSHHH